MLEAIKEDAIESLGYFLKPSELFSAVAKRGNSDTNNFILEDLTAILRSIEQSTMGHESEDDFEHLFEDLDLTSTKLGKTEEAKNTLIAKVLSHLDKIDFGLKNHDRDVLGDAYEYLIAQFASGARKIIFMTDIVGVLDKDKNLLPTLTEAEIEALKADETIHGGMIPKVDACLEAIDGGVEKAHIIDGRVDHSILLEVFTSEGIGTVIKRY